jgi:hypothetical protein
VTEQADPGADDRAGSAAGGGAPVAGQDGAEPGGALPVRRPSSSRDRDRDREHDHDRSHRGAVDGQAVRGPFEVRGGSDRAVSLPPLTPLSRPSSSSDDDPLIRSAGARPFAAAAAAAAARAAAEAAIRGGLDPAAHGLTPADPPAGLGVQGRTGPRATRGPESVSEDEPGVTSHLTFPGVDEPAPRTDADTWTDPGGRDDPGARAEAGARLDAGSWPDPGTRTDAGTWTTDAGTWTTDAGTWTEGGRRLDADTWPGLAGRSGTGPRARTGVPAAHEETAGGGPLASEDEGEVRDSFAELAADFAVGGTVTAGPAGTDVLAADIATSPRATGGAAAATGPGARGSSSGGPAQETAASGDPALGDPAPGRLAGGVGAAADASVSVPASGGFAPDVPETLSSAAAGSSSAGSSGTGSTSAGLFRSTSVGSSVSGSPVVGSPGAGDAGVGIAGGELTRQGDHAVEVEEAATPTLAPLLLHSLADLREIWVPLIEASGARSVAEIGSESGVTTSLLVDLLRRGGGGRLLVVDPDPGVEPTSGGGLDVQVIRGYSPQALDGHAPTDAYLIDGDHNYATVSGELAAIAEAVGRFGRSYFPMVILHDVGWPAGRRDQYYAPDRIPEDSRQPHSWDVGVEVDNGGVVKGGFRGMGAFAWALTEGGPRNGVRTAIEDFIAGQPELRFFTMAPIFGLGVIVDRRAPWAWRVADLLTPWVSNPLLSRLERNRLDLYLHVLRLQDSAAAVARARQREWARLDEDRSRLAAVELEQLARIGELEQQLAEARQREAERDRQATSRGRPTADAPRLTQVARLAGSALRARLGPTGQDRLARVQTHISDNGKNLPALRRRSAPSPERASDGG